MELTVPPDPVSASIGVVVPIMLELLVPVLCVPPVGWLVVGWVVPDEVDPPLPEEFELPDEEVPEDGPGDEPLSGVVVVVEVDPPEPPVVALGGGPEVEPVELVELAPVGGLFVPVVGGVPPEPPPVVVVVVVDGGVPPEPPPVVVDPLPPLVVDPLAPAAPVPVCELPVPVVVVVPVDEVPEAETVNFCVVVEPPEVVTTV